MSDAKLRTLTKKVLAEMAKERGIPGWHAMRKDELVEALAPRKRRRRTSVAKTNGSQPRSAPTRAVSQEERVERAKFEVVPTARPTHFRTNDSLPHAYGKDTITVMVRDPFWLYAYWELTHHAIARAEAAMGQEWHSAKPMLRVLDVSSEDTSSASEAPVQDIEISGGANNWYIHVNDPPRSYRVDVGYLSRSGRFFVLARSNVVTTPRAAVSDVIDEDWTELPEHYQRIYAMSGGYRPGESSLDLKQLFEERLRRPMGSGAVSSFGSGAMVHRAERKFWFQIDAELIVYGATEPGAHVTLQGEPVALRPDGTFTMRFSLPDARQIIPAVATSSDGVEERTIVLAVERNTKELEPMIRDGNE